jgi:hypothetical protein
MTRCETAIALKGHPQKRSSTSPTKERWRLRAARGSPTRKYHQPSWLVMRCNWTPLAGMENNPPTLAQLRRSTPSC